MSSATPEERFERRPVAVAPLQGWERESAPLPAPLTPLLERDGVVAAVGCCHEFGLNPVPLTCENLQCRAPVSPS